jgi:hypothetical protein
MMTFVRNSATIGESRCIRSLALSFEPLVFEKALSKYCTRREALWERDKVLLSTIIVSGLRTALVGGRDTACGGLRDLKANVSANDMDSGDAISGSKAISRWAVNDNGEVGEVGSGSILKVNPDSAGDINGFLSNRILVTVAPGGLGNTSAAVVELGAVSKSRIWDSAELAGEC